MAEPKYDTLKLVGLHEPDNSQEIGPDGNKVSVPLPGMYTIGVLLGGKFVPFHSFKAGNFTDDDNAVAVNKASAGS